MLRRLIGRARVASLALLAPLLACREGDARPAAQSDQFVARTVVDNGTTYHYQVFLPRGYDASRRWPVVLSLHGSGEQGTDGVKPTTVGFGAYVRAHEASFPAIVVFPQGPAGEHGVGRAVYTRIAPRTLDQTIAEFSVDTTRVYMVGISNGASLGFELAFDAPHRFAAFVPVAFGLCEPCFAARPDAPSYERIADSLRTLPIWAFHGAKDAERSLVSIRRIVGLVRLRKGDVHYIEYPDGAHAIWDTAFATPGLMDWMFAQHR